MTKEAFCSKCAWDFEYTPEDVFNETIVTPEDEFTDIEPYMVTCPNCANSVVVKND